MDIHLQTKFITYTPQHIINHWWTIKNNKTIVPNIHQFKIIMLNPKWLICNNFHKYRLSLCWWIGLAMQHDEYSNDNMCNLMKWTSLGNLLQHWLKGALNQSSWLVAQDTQPWTCCRWLKQTFSSFPLGWIHLTLTQSIGYETICYALTIRMHYLPNSHQVTFLFTYLHYNHLNSWHLYQS